MPEYLSKEKRAELESELAELKGSKRREILEALEYAKSLGDLSENAEYHQAREDQGRLEDRVRYLEDLLKSSILIEKGGGDIVDIGSSVVVNKEGSDVSDGKTGKREFLIVGHEEADSVAGKISHQSPLGEALMGKKKGESVDVVTPRGKVTYKISKIS